MVANYFGNKKQYEPVEGKTIHWAGGRTAPPPDIPECGFDGAKCPPDGANIFYEIQIEFLKSEISRYVYRIFTEYFFVVENIRNSSKGSSFYDSHFNIYFLQTQIKNHIKNRFWLSFHNRW